MKYKSSMKFKNFYWYIGIFIIVIIISIGNVVLGSTPNNTEILTNLGVLHHIKILNMPSTQVVANDIKSNLQPTPIVKFRKINNEVAEPSITAQSALVVDFETRDILYNKNGLNKYQLASITKLLTAMVVIDEYKWGDDKYIAMTQTAFDTYGGNSLKVDEQFTVEDILRASLMVSSNDAAQLLAESFGGTEEFITKMNKKAQDLGMQGSEFFNSHGLDQKPTSNYSTAGDIMKLTQDLYDNYPDLTEVLRQKEHILNTKSGQAIRVGNTNEMLNKDTQMILGKTGLTDEAGETFSSVVSIKNRIVGIVVLKSAIGGYRFQDTRNLIKWVEDNYEI
ncbi:MAG: D-alanyl-D-alanine carboxypeptidase family protein [Minisyncoccia bacterium]